MLPREERLQLISVILSMYQFQSTLPRGKRQSPRIRPSRFRNFNPRSREGSDPYTSSAFSHRRLFQSTLPRGERPGGRFYGYGSKVFQSTLPRGERRRSVFMITWTTDFNPRSREGSDDDSACRRGKTHISIRAPARGATMIALLFLLIFKFQSALPRGERRGKG